MLFHACCSDNLSSKCSYTDHRTYILLVDNINKKIFETYYILDIDFAKLANMLIYT